jgi:hypothetical protein
MEGENVSCRNQNVFFFLGQDHSFQLLFLNHYEIKRIAGTNKQDPNKKMNFFFINLCLLHNREDTDD